MIKYLRLLMRVRGGARSVPDSGTPVMGFVSTEAASKATCTMIKTQKEFGQRVFRRTRKRDRRKFFLVTCLWAEGGSDLAVFSRSSTSPAGTHMTPVGTGRRSPVMLMPATAASPITT